MSQITVGFSIVRGQCESLAVIVNCLLEVPFFQQGISNGKISIGKTSVYLNRRLQLADGFVRLTVVSVQNAKLVMSRCILRFQGNGLFEGSERSFKISPRTKGIAQVTPRQRNLTIKLDR